MKKFTYFFALMICLSLGVTSYAQQEQGVNYQAVINNASGQPVASQNVGMRFNIHKGSATGTTVYSETHTVMTTAKGLVNTVIGTGTAGTGTWDELKWNEGPFFLEVETDPAGGTSYTSLGTTELQAVPFAKQSEGVTVYSSGTQNPNKMVIAHSPAYTDWGLRYYDTGDVFQFVNGGDTVMEVNLAGNDVTVNSVLNIEGELRTPATGTANMVPIAYGTISSSGTIHSGTGNFTVNKTATGRYVISINNQSYHYTNYTAIATVVGSPSFIATTSAGGDLMIYTYNSSSAAADRIFQFVVYKN